MMDVTWKTRLKGLLFGIFVILSPLQGIIFLTGWMIPMLYISPRIYRSMVDVMVGWWLVFPASMAKYLLGIKIKITGDKIPCGESNIILMNHRTRLDWLYFWSVLVEQSGTRTEKIVLKAPLKKIPGSGWAMQNAGFMFLERRWEDDKTYMTQMMDYFAHISYKIQVLIFPEGTNYDAKTKAKSDSFAQKNNLPIYENVLHPRTTGFTFLMQEMRKGGLDAVYDVHVAYPKGCYESEVDLCLGKYTEEVHFHIKRYDAASLPASKDDLEEWLKDLWRAKENILDDYYHNQPGEFSSLNKETHQSDNDNLLQLALAFWVIFTIATLALLYYSIIADIYFVLCIAMFVYMQSSGGFELFQAKLVNSRIAPEITSDKTE